MQCKHQSDSWWISVRQPNLSVSSTSTCWQSILAIGVAFVCLACLCPSYSLTSEADRACYNSLIYASTKMATGKVGSYDHDFVDESHDCPVCLLTLRDPHVVSCCRKEFCQFCIERIWGDGKPCSLCNESSFTTFPHKKLAGEVNDLVVHCPQLGCGWKGELVQLE